MKRKLGSGKRNDADVNQPQKRRPPSLWPQDRIPTFHHLNKCIVKDLLHPDPDDAKAGADRPLPLYEIPVSEVDLGMAVAAPQYDPAGAPAQPAGAAIAFSPAGHAAATIAAATIAGPSTPRDATETLPLQRTKAILPGSRSWNDIEESRLAASLKAADISQREMRLLRQRTVRHSDEPVLPPAKLGRRWEQFYRMESKPAAPAGTFGTVYYATELATGMIRAIKIIRKQQEYKDQHQLQQYRNEIDLMLQASHPAVVKAVDAFETPTELYFGMIALFSFTFKLSLTVHTELSCVCSHGGVLWRRLM